MVSKTSLGYFIRHCVTHSRTSVASSRSSMSPDATSTGATTAPHATTISSTPSSPASTAQAEITQSPVTMMTSSAELSNTTQTADSSESSSIRAARNSSPSFRLKALIGIMASIGVLALLFGVMTLHIRMRARRSYFQELLVYEPIARSRSSSLLITPYPFTSHFQVPAPFGASDVRDSNTYQRRGSTGPFNPRQPSGLDSGKP